MESQSLVPARKILVVGKDADILKTVLRLLNDFKSDHYEAGGALNVREAQEAFEEQEPDLVLLTNGLDETETRTLRSFFHNQRPGVPVLQHYGGGSGLLFNELTYLFNSAISTHGHQRSA